PQRTVIETDVELPRGWGATVPESAHEEGPEGAYTVSYRKDGAKVTARLELTLRGGTLQPAQYPAFREFLGRLDASLRRRVEARPFMQTAALDTN
ncbi:MAG TPA: hypothetical protein VGH20_00950, partial [Myxococcales bacterium]